MLITVFVFLGIEGASVYSRFAKKREDVGRATVIGFLSVLSVFALVTLLSYGVLPQQELAGVSQPSMASVLESIVGPWGSTLIRVGVVLSVLGAYLAWSLMAAEILYIPAKADDMPRFLARTNSKGAPVVALVLAGGLVQLLLILLLFTSDALNFMLDLTAALSLIPYLLAAAYAVKLTVTRETYENGRALRSDAVVAGIATFYTLFLIYAAGLDKLLLSCILYAVGAGLYVIARRERNLRVFSPAEAVLFAVIVAGAVAGVVSLATGAIRDLVIERDRHDHNRPPPTAFTPKWARLHKVLVCSPGLAHERLTPTNCDDLLFDDVLWVQNARRDHFDFVSKMRDRGVEVVELHNVLTETMSNPEAKAWLLDREIVPNDVGSGLVDETRGLPGLVGAATAGRVPDRRDVHPRPAHGSPVRLPSRWPARRPASPSTCCRRCPTRSTPVTPPAGSTAA